jgi:hypothetical protein
MDNRRTARGGRRQAAGGSRQPAVPLKRTWKELLQQPSKSRITKRRFEVASCVRPLCVSVPDKEATERARIPPRRGGGDFSLVPRLSFRARWGKEARWVEESRKGIGHKRNERKPIRITFWSRILAGKECPLSAIAIGCKLKIKAFCSV